MYTQSEGAIATERRDLRAFSGMRVHFVGVGGSGMSGAAALLQNLGAFVTGSDLAPFDGMGALVNAGARVTVGHRADQLPPDVELVVISAAIRESNPELAAARLKSIPIICYAELVGQLMRRHRKGVAIAGTHGKSTTTALCAHLFRECGLEPTFLVGARSQQLGGSSGLGSGEHFIVESCEFGRSFLQVRPESAVILNVEPDHLDFYRDFEEIVEAFGDFAANVHPDGLLVCNSGDSFALTSSRRSRARVETVGLDALADWVAVNLECELGCYSFEVRFQGEPVLRSRLAIPGQYNVGNALAAIALAHHAGAGPHEISQALPTFRGVSRRLSWRGEGRGVTIIDDYAHHPTEIRVTIEAARYRYLPKRTFVVFQPHQHSRTRHFMDAFAESLAGADEIIVPDVYGARETSTSDETCGSQALVSRICASGGRACYVPALEKVAEHVVRQVAEGDLVLVMGAGDVWKVADELVARICRPCST